MPLYEYECGSCGRRFERIQKFSDPPVTDCPECGGPVRKLFSSPAIQFKGSGFYITDYAKSGRSAEPGAPAGAEKPAAETAKGGEGAAAASSSGAQSDSPAGTPKTEGSSKPESPKPAGKKSD